VFPIFVKHRRLRMMGIKVFFNLCRLPDGKNYVGQATNIGTDTVSLPKDAFPILSGIVSPWRTMRI
jgi:hypothetical protein